MDTSPLLPRTNIPIAVKQLFGKAIGNVTLVFVLLPHCLIEVQWGSGEENFTFPISFTQTCFSVFLTRKRGGYEYSLIVASKSLTNVTWISRGHGNGGGDALGYILAIGI